MRGSMILAILFLAGLARVTAAQPFPLQCEARANPGSIYQPPYVISFQTVVSGGEGAYTFHWDFGDGGQSNEQNPVYQYASSGWYFPVVTVRDGGFPPRECRDSVGVTVSVVVDPICGSEGSPTWGPAPLTVRFSGYEALGPPAARWEWSFGDGGTSGSPNPTHTYALGTYWAALTMWDDQGHAWQCYSTVRVSATPSDVAGVPSSPVERLRLEPARPNPLTGEASIEYRLPTNGHVSLAVVDASGRRLGTLVEGMQGAGPHRLTWAARTDRGTAVRPGLYLVVLEFEGERRVEKIAVVR